jgi:hypothetical protein
MLMTWRIVPHGRTSVLLWRCACLCQMCMWLLKLSSSTAVTYIFASILHTSASPTAVYRLQTPFLQALVNTHYCCGLVCSCSRSIRSFFRWVLLVGRITSSLVWHYIFTWHLMAYNSRLITFTSHTKSETRKWTNSEMFSIW